MAAQGQRGQPVAPDAKPPRCVLRSLSPRQGDPRVSETSGLQLGLRARVPSFRAGAKEPRGETPLTSLCQQLKLCRGLPQSRQTASSDRRPRPGPTSAAASEHVKRAGGATANRRVFADANPEQGKEAIPGRTRTARDWEERVSR